MTPDPSPIRTLKCLDCGYEFPPPIAGDVYILDLDHLVIACPNCGVDPAKLVAVE